MCKYLSLYMYLCVCVCVCVYVCVWVGVSLARSLALSLFPLDLALFSVLSPSVSSMVHWFPPLTCEFRAFSTCSTCKHNSTPHDTDPRTHPCTRLHYDTLPLLRSNYVVLDEADRMVDMGFAEQLATVLNAMPSTALKSTDEEVAARQEQADDRVYRTTVLFSATMPPAVERLSREYLRRPAHVTIGEAGGAADRVTQVVEWVPNEHRKRARLAELLAESDPPVIVFVNTKRDCDVVWKAIRGLGYHPCKLHSGRSQDQREEALKGFRDGVYDVLVGTDVAGRGIDGM
jgi:ATP-dependent RNA helicase DDX23/PRP28